MRSALYSILALTLSLGLIAAVGAADKAKDKTPPKEAPVVPPRKGESETIQLFDGKDLKGWEGDKSLWSVQDGEIVGKSKGEVKVSTYLLTKKHFSDFRITLMGKLVESETHTGVCFWGKKAPGARRSLHPRRPSGDVSLRLGHVGSVWPQWSAGRGRCAWPESRGRQAA